MLTPRWCRFVLGAMLASTVAGEQIRQSESTRAATCSNPRGVENLLQRRQRETHCSRLDYGYEAEIEEKEAPHYQEDVSDYRIRYGLGTHTSFTVHFRSDIPIPFANLPSPSQIWAAWSSNQLTQNITELKASDGSWEVRPTKGKGLGVFALRDIAKDTHIMIEAPLFSIEPGRFVAGQGYSLQGLAGAVEEAFAGLNETTRAEYLSCHEHRAPGETGDMLSREVVIFRSNAYSMPGGRAGIFPRIAKINHSCRPNAGNAFGEGRGARVIFAGRDIVAGEEITVTYAPLTEGRETRRARLAQYGFACGCEACSADEAAREEEDRRRTEMGQLFKKVEAELGSRTWGGDVLPEAQRLARMVEEERFSFLADYRARAYRLAAYAASRKGDYGTSRRWARRELEVHEMADGGSPQAQAARDFIAGLPLM